MRKRIACAAILAGITSCRIVRHLRVAVALATIVFAAWTANAITPNLSGTLNSADPSPLVWDGSIFYQFTTGTQGIWYSTSPNLSAWTAGGYVSPTGTTGVYPSWIQTYVPSWTVGNIWAPDVVKIGNMYYMYYAVSSFGTSNSAIGLSVATSLQTMNWQDQGVVVSSNGASNAINAIDPALFQDSTNGNLWLSYGSYFGGIAVVQIDPATMKVKSGATPTVIAGGNPVGANWEGSYITQSGGYYYLWANRGQCCEGVSSTYTIVVGRSTSVTGPYVNESGTALTANGANGTLMWGSVGNKLSPGGPGVLAQNGCNYFSYFYYDSNQGGNTFLDILELTYAGGWPVLTNNFTVGQCGTLSVSPTSYTFPSSSGGSTAISVTANENWTVSSNASWLTSTPSSGSNNGTFEAEAASYTGSTPRGGVLTVSTTNGQSATVTVTQPGTDSLSVSPTSLTLSNAASQTTINVTSNAASWTVSSDSATWLTVSAASGSGNGSFTATASANTGSARNGTITLTGGGLSATVSVSQDAGASGGPLAAGTYRIENYDSDYSISASGGSDSAVMQAAYTGTPSEQWVVTVSRGVYQFKSVVAGDTNNVIMDQNSQSANGTLLVMGANTSSTVQEYTITPCNDDSGAYYIIANNGGSYVGLNQYAGPGQQLQLQLKESYNWQRWVFVAP
jgi:Glycosyl hydrolases family 43/Viral BACON domain